MILGERNFIFTGATLVFGGIFRHRHEFQEQEQAELVSFFAGNDVSCIIYTERGPQMKTWLIATKEFRELLYNPRFLLVFAAGASHPPSTAVTNRIPCWRSSDSPM